MKVLVCSPAAPQTTTYMITAKLLLIKTNPWDSIVEKRKQEKGCSFE